MADVIPPMPPVTEAETEQAAVTRPQSVSDMGRFWFAAWVVQALVQGLSAVELATNSAYRESMIQALGAENAEMYRANLTTGTIVSGAVIGVGVILVVSFFLCRGATQGRTVPRVLLSIGAAYLVFSTITSIFLPADPGSTWFVWASGVLAIISGVCAALGLWFSFTKESAEYYVQVKSAKGRR